MLNWNCSGKRSRKWEVKGERSEVCVGGQGEVRRKFGKLMCFREMFAKWSSKWKEVQKNIDSHSYNCVFFFCFLLIVPMFVHFFSYHLSRVELSRKVNWRTLSKNQSGRLKR